MHTFTALARQLREAREAQAMTIDALSGATGIWLTRLKKIESGQTGSIIELCRILAALKLRMEIR